MAQDGAINLQELRQKRGENRVDLTALRTQRAEGEGLGDFTEPAPHTAEVSTLSTPDISQQAPSRAQTARGVLRPIAGQNVLLPLEVDGGAVNVLDAFVRGSTNAVQRGLKSASVATFDLTNFMRRQFGYDELDSAQDTRVYEMAENIEKATKEAFPGSKELQDDFFTAQLPGMAGELSTQVLVGAVTGWSGVAVLGATYASDEYENAIKAGSDEDTAFNTWLMNVPVGALEAFPIAAFYSRFNRLTGGSVKEVLKGGFVGAGENLVQEAAGQYARNVIASNSYDEMRRLSAGVEEQAFLGGAVGFALNAVGLSFKIRAHTDPKLTPTERATMQEAWRHANEEASHLGKPNQREGGRFAALRARDEQAKKVSTDANQVDSKSPGNTQSNPATPLSGDKTNSQSRFKSWFREWFTSGGLFPEALYNQVVYRDGRTSAESERVRFTIRDFNREVIEQYAPDSGKGLIGFFTGRQIPKSALENLDAAFRGDVDTSTLPGKLPEIVTRMRDHVDGLSQEFIRKGIISGKLETKFLENIGSYVHRQYEVYQYKSDWAQRVKKENPAIIARAEQHLIDGYKKAHKGKAPSPAQLRNLINDILEGNYKGNLIYQNRQKFEKEYDLGPLLKRQDIALPIRELMGEIRNPVTNYIETVERMSTILETRQMYQNWRDQFEGTFFFTDRASRPDGFNFMIKAGKDPVFAPLNNMRTNKDIYTAMQKVDQATQDPAWLKMLLAANSAAKYSKVIVSHTTQSRNVVGGLKYMLQSGTFPHMSEFREGFRAVQDVFVNTKTPEARQKLEHWTELGLRKKGIIGKEIAESIRDWSGDSLDSIDLTRSLVHKGVKGPLRAGATLARKATDLYLAGDDMLRIAFFQNELRRLRVADPNITEREVADRVLRYYQNYDSLPKVVKATRKIPAVAPFLSHSYEVIRTKVNAAKFATQEIQSDNPAMRRIGYQRMVGLGASAILSPVTAMTARNLLGISYDREEDMRRFLAPWDSNSTLLPLSFEGGNVRFINLSYVDIDEVISDPVMTMFGRGATEDQTTKIQIWNALAQFMQPLFQEEIFFKSANEVYNNQKDSGASVYNTQDDWGTQVADMYLHMWSAFEPGSVTSVKRAYEGIAEEDGPNEPSDEILGLFGARITGVDIANSFGFRTRDYRNKVQESRRIYNSARYSEEASAADKAQALQQANVAYKRNFDRMVGDVSAARRLGIREDILMEHMNDSGLSQTEVQAILYNDFIPFEPTLD